jgi:hypothetical protein
LELDDFLSQHGIDIRIFAETHLRPRDVFRLARPADGGRRKSNTGQRQGIGNFAVPILGVTQLEATAIYIMLAGGLMKILTVYILCSWPLIGSDLSACMAEGFPS